MSGNVKKPVKLIDMIRVPKAALGSVCGLPWTEALKAGMSGSYGCSVDALEYGYVSVQSENPQWKPQVDEKLQPRLYLPLEFAWLRERDGRVVLYLQNW